MASDAFRPSTAQWQHSGARWRVSRNSARQILIAILVSLFALSMIEMMARIDRFQVASSQQIVNHDFLHGLQGWSGSAFEARGMHAVYRSESVTRSGELRQTMALSPGYYRISVEASAAISAAISGTDTSGRPRVHLEFATQRRLASGQ